MLHEVGLWRKANKIIECQISNVKCKKHDHKKKKWAIITLGFAAYFASANSFLWCLNISIRELLLFLTNYLRSRLNCPSQCEALFQLDYFYLNSNCFPPLFVIIFYSYSSDKTASIITEICAYTLSLQDHLVNALLQG